MRFMIIALLLSLSGCMWNPNVRQTYAEADIAEAKAGILMDYRQCLRDRAANPERQKDCGVYNQAMIQLQVTGLH